MAEGKPRIPAPDERRWILERRETLTGFKDVIADGPELFYGDRIEVVPADQWYEAPAAHPHTAASHHPETIWVDRDDRGNLTILSAGDESAEAARYILGESREAGLEAVLREELAWLKTPDNGVAPVAAAHRADRIFATLSDLQELAVDQVTSKRKDAP